MGKTLLITLGILILIMGMTYYVYIQREERILKELEQIEKISYISSSPSSQSIPSLIEEREIIFELIISDYVSKETRVNLLERFAELSDRIEAIEEK